MAQAPAVSFKIPTKIPQPAHGKTARPAARARTGRPATGRVLARGTGRAATRGGRTARHRRHGAGTASRSREVVDALTRTELRSGNPVELRGFEP